MCPKERHNIFCIQNGKDYNGISWSGFLGFKWAFTFPLIPEELGKEGGFQDQDTDGCSQISHLGGWLACNWVKASSATIWRQRASCICWHRDRCLWLQSKLLMNVHMKSSGSWNWQVFFSWQHTLKIWSPKGWECPTIIFNGLGK